MINPTQIDQGVANLTALITGLGTLAGVAYTAWQNFKAKKQLTEVHKETIDAITNKPESKDASGI